MAGASYALCGVPSLLFVNATLAFLIGVSCFTYFNRIFEVGSYLALSNC